MLSSISLSGSDPTWGVSSKNRDTSQTLRTLHANDPAPSMSQYCSPIPINKGVMGGTRKRVASGSPQYTQGTKRMATSTPPRNYALSAR